MATVDGAIRLKPDTTYDHLINSARICVGAKDYALEIGLANQ